ncbi:DNA-processing protein DprA [Brenneria izbisi]|uniref:DNA-protecting protein DprA n=1 Tax=Brenneria izbisi TaxID=2939450 RepID=A0AA41XYN0_9GAMM|nr:DNA-processing protein DprA [Brenneria izbisi]MCV9880024.1 DNA-protecting protein DprA [Brenneria izbisi]MCV9883413.1 DNA-protecting protein DprA [Brenneria izbisi]
MKDNLRETITPSTKLLLTLSMLKGVGPVLLKKTASYVLSSNVFSINELSKFDVKIASLVNDDDNFLLAQEKAEKQIEYAEQYSFRIISILDNDYPKLLSETKDNPCLLYVKGSLFESPDKSVAIIGTREPTSHGKVITERITKFFVEKNWSIVSGLAIGCDGIAHETALNCHGHTVAVLAHGLQTIAPSRHKNLAQRIIEEGGALITEYPFGQEIQKQQYVKRDRIQAGLARGVVMIQSDVKGGSLHASRASLDYNRWLAVPYPTKDDIARNEPKAQANLLIANGSDSDKAGTLRFDKMKLKNIIILNGKEDYNKLIEDVCFEKVSTDIPFVADMFDSHSNSGSDESYMGAYEDHVLQEFNPISNGEAILGNLSEAVIKTDESFLDHVVDTDEVKGISLEKLIVSSDFISDFDLVIKNITNKNKNLTSKLGEQDEKLQLVKLRFKIISKNLKLMHKDKFFEENNPITVLKNKIIVEDVLFHMLKVISLCDFEHTYMDTVIVLKDKIDNVLLNFPDSVILCDAHSVAGNNCNSYNDERFVNILEEFNRIVLS